jgi:hypothetical protein
MAMRVPTSTQELSTNYSTMQSSHDERQHLLALRCLVEATEREQAAQNTGDQPFNHAEHEEDRLTSERASHVRPTIRLFDDTDWAQVWPIVHEVITQAETFPTNPP